jgi:hypothetical protein
MTGIKLSSQLHLFIYNNKINTPNYYGFALQPQFPNPSQWLNHPNQLLGEALRHQPQESQNSLKNLCPGALLLGLNRGSSSFQLSDLGQGLGISTLQFLHVLNGNKKHL